LPEYLVTSDASPIMNLAIMGQLDLLKLAQAIWKETVLDGEGKAGVSDIKKAKWIKVVKVKKTPLVQLLKKDLDNGEAETIAYALQKKNVLVLLEEDDAKEMADFYGIEKT